MIYEIKTVDGVKTKVPLTGNGYGLPLGSIIAVYSNLVPDGYLPCNGAVYDTTTYAALYAYLGSNKLPDLRECTLVGAGQSDNEYDANDNPTGIQAHDVYTVGQFKDDQLQGHYHNSDLPVSSTARTIPGGQSYYGGGGIKPTETGITSAKTDGTNGTPRVGTTTHGKQMGVNYCIKATPAYVEPDTVSDMVNTLRTQDSYSTSEVNTGKKWIDGKPIYRKTYYSPSGWTNNIVLDTIPTIGVLVHALSTASNGTYYITNPTSNDHNFLVGLNNNTHQIVTLVSGVYLNNNPCWATIEYTKTTD